MLKRYIKHVCLFLTKLSGGIFLENLILKNGDTLTYHIHGHGKPVLLIHGFTSFGLSWNPQLTSLIYSGYQVIIPDLRGHGLSAEVDVIVTVDDLSGDMFQLLDHLDLSENVVVCGLSLGGMIAQKMALTDPSRLKGIVIANSTPNFNEVIHLKVCEAWISLFQQSNGAQLRLEKNWDKLVNQSFRDSVYGKSVYDSWQKVLAKRSGESFINIAKGMLDFDVRQQLDQIKIPVQVITSTQDEIFDQSKSQHIHKSIQESRLSVLEDSGHISNLDNPLEFNSVLLKFLKDIM